MTLDEYLEAALRKRWRWGGVNGQDCTIFAADWAFARTGRDPGDGIRGTYSTEAEALAIVEQAGGMVAFIASRLEPLGWRRMQCASHGDIGVILAPQEPDGEMGLMPAIFQGGLWVARSPRGIRGGEFMPVAIWSVA